MFDIGFLEIGLIFVVALLVIGPERLPSVARNIGFWLGKIRKFVSNVQEDFHREVVKTEELKNLLEEQSKIKDVHEILEQSVDDSRKTISIGADLSPEKKDNDDKFDNLDGSSKTGNSGSTGVKDSETGDAPAGLPRQNERNEKNN